MNFHHQRRVGDDRDRRDVADEIEAQPLVERRVNRVRRCGEEQGVAVRRRPYERLGRDVGAGSGAGLDQKLLAEPLGEPLPDHARNGVGRATGGVPDQNAYRLARIVVRRRDPREGRKRGSTRCQMQKKATRKFHDESIL